MRRKFSPSSLVSGGENLFFLYKLIKDFPELRFRAQWDKVLLPSLLVAFAPLNITLEDHYASLLKCPVGGSWLFGTH